MEVVVERIEGLKTQLVSRDNSHETDTFLKGMIWAYNEVLDVQPAITVEDIENAV